MKLYQHPDFESAVEQASEWKPSAGWRPALIEKDYFVTEALRVIAMTAGERVIFKGGTSLSKGWGLIERFSEDIDIFLEPPASKNAINRELKALRDTVAAHSGLTFLPEESRTIGGFGRSDRFLYPQRFPEPAVVNQILCEVGTASGREPTETVSLSSFLAHFLTATGASLEADDESAFPMRLLHFRRTFVEKMFAIHSKVQQSIASGQPIGGYARHYYDLYQLSTQPEVLALLRSDEYATICADYDRISRASFASSHFPPENLRFTTSDALFPSTGLASELGRQYDAQCRVLCYGQFPDWPTVLARFEELRPLL